MAKLPRKLKGHTLFDYDNLCLKFFNIEDAGKVLVRGVKDKGDIKNTDVLNEAFKLGHSM